MEGNAAVAVAERADKRLPAQLRPSEAVVGVVTRADGSTRCVYACCVIGHSI